MEESGIDTVFVENEIFGLGVVKTVMNGGHHVRGKLGIGLISKAYHLLQLLEFLKRTDCSQFQVSSCLRQRGFVNARFKENGTSVKSKCLTLQIRREKTITE